VSGAIDRQPFVWNLKLFRCIARRDAHAVRRSRHPRHAAIPLQWQKLDPGGRRVIEDVMSRVVDVDLVFGFLMSRHG
jgi:hypothetical protein